MCSVNDVNKSHYFINKVYFLPQIFVNYKFQSYIEVLNYQNILFLV